MTTVENPVYSFTHRSVKQEVSTSPKQHQYIIQPKGQLSFFNVHDGKNFQIKGEWWMWQMIRQGTHQFFRFKKLVRTQLLHAYLRGLAFSRFASFKTGRVRLS